METVPGYWIHRENAWARSSKSHDASGIYILGVTVSKRLHKRGLFARRRTVCVPLTSTNRIVRLAYCRQHRDWSIDQWATFLFTDESRFSLSTDSRRTLIWRQPRTHSLPSNVPEIDIYGGGGLMV
ncbi:transposable element Tcb2 transposase [Trichonephila clavipes]|nr:transposable element Tcb2 transposase [Trichonephila clavipes]